jgi:hypothetical protein
MNIRPACLLLALALMAPLTARSQISVSVRIGPPLLPVYVQPRLPGAGYIWTPGYWGWSEPDQDYYWVPGTWVRPPRVGVLWTPGYWGVEGGLFRWRLGYWGPRVGFYGGVNYGFGYGGSGYQGGRWNGRVFNYNTTVNNVDRTVIRNVYTVKVVNNVNVTRVSYNGGPNGVKAEPTAVQLREQQVKHLEPTATQVEHEVKALKTPTQKASVHRRWRPPTRLRISRRPAWRMRATRRRLMRPTSRKTRRRLASRRQRRRSPRRQSPRQRRPARQRPLKSVPRNVPRRALPGVPSSPRPHPPTRPHLPTGGRHKAGGRKTPPRSPRPARSGGRLGVNSPRPPRPHRANSAATSRTRKIQNGRRTADESAKRRGELLPAKDRLEMP